MERAIAESNRMGSTNQGSNREEEELRRALEMSKLEDQQRQEDEQLKKAMEYSRQESLKGQMAEGD